MAKCPFAAGLAGVTAESSMPAHHIAPGIYCRRQYTCPSDRTRCIITMKEETMGYQGGGGGFGAPREMHKAVCSDCKKECEVPFKPRNDRPIYCKDCYSKRKNEGR